MIAKSEWCGDPKKDYMQNYKNLNQGNSVLESMGGPAKWPSLVCRVWKPFLVIMAAIYLLLWWAHHMTAADVAFTPAPEPSWRVQITDDFEIFQFKPMGDPLDPTMVIVGMERTVTPEGEVEWVIDQAAGPWGNSALLDDPRYAFDETFSPEFMRTWEAAQRIGLGLSGAIDFEWSGGTIDVRSRR